MRWREILFYERPTASESFREYHPNKIDNNDISFLIQLLYTGARYQVVECSALVVQS